MPQVHLLTQKTRHIIQIVHNEFETLFYEYYPVELVAGDTHCSDQAWKTISPHELNPKAPQFAVSRSYF